MPDSAHFQRLVEGAVQQALDDARADLTTRVMHAIAPALVPPDDTERLATSIRTIEAAHAQTDILGALLAGCADFATRCALFVARGVSAPMWQSAGFADESALRGVSAQVGTGLGASAMTSLAPVDGNPREFDERLVEVAGAPSNGKCIVLPLVVREKVAALIYADAGQEGECDVHALEILVRAAGSRIEIAATRKAPQQSAASMPAPSPMASTPSPVVSAPMAAAPAPVAAPTYTSQPSFSHAPAAAATATAPAPMHPPTPAVQPQRQTPAPSPIVAAPPAPGDEVHVKARRFAKLLVEEIKLYNQQEVTAGKQAGDLYDRLREPIDKSREAYERRYANTPAAAANYFGQELVRILADNNMALLGPNFAR